MLTMPRKSLPPIRAAVSMALCLSVWPQVARAQLAVPAPIVPPSQGGLVPIQPNTPEGGLQPIQPVTPLSIDSQTSISAAAVTAPAVMAQIEAGRLTPEKAWDTGALTVPDLIYILDRYVSEWGFINGMNNGMDQVELRRDLAGLLVKHGGVNIEKPATIPVRVRLWLTDYFMSIGDPHIVMMGESILNDVKAPVGSEDPLVFQTLEQLGRHYTTNGELDKGTQTWARMKDYYAPASRFIPDALIEMARLDLQTGYVNQAQELYAQVPKYGNGWFTGVSLIDQAHLLMRKNKYDEARRLLQQTITGSDK